MKIQIGGRPPEALSLYLLRRHRNLLLAVGQEEISATSPTRRNEITALLRGAANSCLQSLVHPHRQGWTREDQARTLAHKHLQAKQKQPAHGAVRPRFPPLLPLPIQPILLLPLPVHPMFGKDSNSHPDPLLNQAAVHQPHLRSHLRSLPPHLRKSTRSVQQLQSTLLIENGKSKRS